MYILENIKLKNTIVGLSIAAVALLTSGCNSEKDVKITNATNVKTEQRAVDGAVKYEVKDGKYTQYHVNTQKVGPYNHGREATKREIAAWDIDVTPFGNDAPMYDMKHGLVVLNEDGTKKVAQGSVALGNELYDAQCAMCHGDFGSGGAGYPTLSGGEIESLKNQLMNPADKDPGMEPPKRTIGTYWPYASTLFWYIQDAMPFPHPKSLSNSETYAITAYLLMENGITIDGEDLDEDYILNREKFLKIKMPNADGFYPNVDTPEDPKQGVRNMTKFLSDPQNYGAGTRCMTDCIKEDVSKLVMRISDGGLSDFNPPASTVRDLPPVKESAGPVHPGKAGYEAFCSACHANEAIGAPVIGNKEVWAEVMEKGLEKVYHNGINGINAMPPKGGNMDLTDEETKVIIDYMIEASK